MYLIKEKLEVILKDLQQYQYPQSLELSSYLLKEEGAADWRPATADERWGGRNTHCEFRLTATIPPSFDGKTVVYSVKTDTPNDWNASNPQFVLYINGQLQQGLDVNHTEALLTPAAKAGDTYDIRLEAYSGMHGDLSEFHSRIMVLDTAVEKLYYHIKVPLEIASLLDEGDKRRIDILQYLDHAVNLTDLTKPHSEAFDRSILAAIAYLDEEFYGKFCRADGIAAHCVGHTHIDVAWQWTLAQTREKTVRSFSTVLQLMKEYPEYIFMSSQPQLYQYFKEQQPELYEQIKQRIAEGRWEAEGAMWLEADCNVTSGESLVRQILFGTRFFQREFGVKNRILWLPDVFGYCSALPQILKKSGIDYFMTTKINWNEYNKLPYDTFLWQGLDGTEILTHFITTQDYRATDHNTTYVGMLEPSHIMGAWKRYQQKDLSDEVLVCYGYGDGGGGPTKKMLEYGRRMEKGIPGCPAVRQGTALDYFERLEKTVAQNKKLPKWVGELYLEFHRGTYTSMARNKKNNRKSERLYQDAELFSVIGQQLCGLPYPQEQLNAGWETILLNQFHDILPGTSIKEVYDDCDTDYARVKKQGETALTAAISNIAGQTACDRMRVVVFNQTGFVRSDMAEFTLPQGYASVVVEDMEGSQMPLQISGDRVLFLAQDVPPKGYKTFRIKPGDRTAAGNMTVTPTRLANDYFDISLDENANITSIYDKRSCRQVLKEGERANVLQAFEDRPRDWDAWEISIYYQDKMYLIDQAESIEVIENGPIRGGIRVKRHFLDSVIVQNIYIYSQSPRIDFQTWIDWKESKILLKAAFPVDVHAEKATFDVQFGNVERPTHWNTSWDWARFEVCAHKWADLSENGYGVSLLNDCKYGHDIKDGVIRLTLLKSALFPNPQADKEIHQFTYSFYPHAGDWKEAETEKMAIYLNCPLYVQAEQGESGTLPPVYSLISLDANNVIVDTVKQAEDSDDMIVRVYEYQNRRTRVHASCFGQIMKLTECDLMEQDIETLDFEGGSFDFEIKPYEIKTFKIKCQEMQ